MTADSCKTSCSFVRCEKRLLPTTHVWTVAATLVIFFGVERVKRYVYNLLSVLYFVTNTIFVLIDYPLLQPLSVSVWLNVRFTPTVCLKTYTHTYEARTSEDLKYKKQAQSINQSLCSGPQPEV